MYRGDRGNPGDRPRMRNMVIRDGVSVMVAGDRIAGALARASRDPDGPKPVACSDVADQVIRMIDQAVVSDGMIRVIRQWMLSEQFIADADDASIHRLQVAMMKQIRIEPVPVPARAPNHGGDDA